MSQVILHVPINHKLQGLMFNQIEFRFFNLKLLI